MAERTVRILGFNYTDEEGIERMARRHDVIDFSDEDTARGDADGAFMVPEGEAVEAEVVITSASTDEELEAFVKDANVKEVVAAAGDDTDFAHRLLAAENDATGNDPRKGVAEGLAAVVGAA
jgi:hypothetical protein